MYCNICHQKEHEPKELCPKFNNDNRMDLYVPPREPEIGEWYWGEDE